MIISSRRTLLQALTVSLLLHAVLLSSAVRLFRPSLDVPARTINAVIRDQRPGDPGLPVGTLSARSPGEAARSPAPHVQMTPRVVAAPSVAAAAPAEAPLAPSEIAPAVSVNAGGGRSAASPGQLSGAPSGASSGVARQGVSADDLRQYRLSLAGAARRFKNYPALARQRGWEGTVEVALTVSAQAAVPDVVLVRSSGRGVLDEQALDMLAQAARVTALPEGLKARDFRIVLPVQFSLEDDQ